MRTPARIRAVPYGTATIEILTTNVARRALGRYPAVISQHSRLALPPRRRSKPGRLTYFSFFANLWSLSSSSIRRFLMRTNPTCSEVRKKIENNDENDWKKIIAPSPSRQKNHPKTPIFPIANLEFPCYTFSVFRLEGGSRSMIAKLFLISNKRVNMAGPTRSNRWSQP
jgi:hypothetical protein